MRALAYTITNPTYMLMRNGKIAGTQSKTVDQLINELESAVRDLKSRTTQERREETATIVQGFKGRLTRKITCQLGYLRSYKSESERIVKCVDNRSIKEQGGEEGYLDMRVIILSIDAKTLEPISLLDIAG